MQERLFKEEFQRYLWNMHCNGDIFAEYWRPINDGGVKVDDNTEHLETFRYKSKKKYSQ